MLIVIIDEDSIIEGEGNEFALVIDLARAVGEVRQLRCCAEVVAIEHELHHDALHRGSVCNDSPECVAMRM